MTDPQQHDRQVREQPEKEARDGAGASPATPAGVIERLGRMKAEGLITEEQYQAAKRRLER